MRLDRGAGWAGGGTVGEGHYACSWVQPKPATAHGNSKTATASAAQVLGKVGPLLCMALASSTAATVPARHKPRHPTIRPSDAVPSASDVGVVDAIIVDRP